MARMSIDDMVQRDPRITKLGMKVGWSRRETLGCLVLDIWPICYDQRESTISAELVDIAAGAPGFAAAMVECELAEWVRGNRKVRIRGAQERIEYLDHKKRAGREGGLKSAESRDKISSTRGSTPQAAGNPPSPSPVPSSASAPVPVLSEKNSAAPSAGGVQPGFQAFELSIKRNLGEVGLQRARGKRPKPSEPTDAERATARTVLDKLGSYNGVRYSGTAEHTRLIAKHLRDGITERELRMVIGYCCFELGWLDKPDMAKYLRPETLFGPQTLSKYLDPARAWFAKLPADESTPSVAPAEDRIADALTFSGLRWEEPAWMSGKGNA